MTQNSPRTVGQVSRAILDVVATVAVIVIAVVMVWRGFVRANTQTEQGKRSVEPALGQTISIADLPTIGGDAALVVVEFGDFQCPACAKFANGILPDLVSRLVESGRLQMAFRHFPLPNHPDARAAAGAAHCAGQQAKFWDYSSILFRDTVSAANLTKTALQLGLDESRWEECLVAPSTAAVIRRDLDEAKRLGLRATPAFLIGARQSAQTIRVSAVLYGARPVEDFENAIRQLASSPTLSR